MPVFIPVPFESGFCCTSAFSWEDVLIVLAIIAGTFLIGLFIAWIFITLDNWLDPLPSQKDKTLFQIIADQIRWLKTRKIK